MEMEFNVNSYVKVKLKPLGIKILKEQREELYSSLNTTYKPMKEYPEIDEAGYTKFQLWDFMNKFGHHTNMVLDIPFETDIILIKEEPYIRLEVE